MNKIKNLFLCGLLSMALTAAATEKTQQKSDAMGAYSAPQVILYESNNDKKIIQTLPSTVNLVRIYQQGDWIKVGNTADGTVGWINKLQYQKTLEKPDQANIQQVFISQTVDKDNKPQVKIVAYQNGKLMSEKEVQSLYDDIKEQQKLQAQYWQELNRNMIHWQNQISTSFFQDPFFNQMMPLPMPIVIIEKSDSKKD